MDENCVLYLIYELASGAIESHRTDIRGTKVDLEALKRSWTPAQYYGAKKVTSCRFEVRPEAA